MRGLKKSLSSQGLVGGAGVICVVGVMGASMTMNFLYGFGLGTTLITALLWGALSVFADGLKAVLPVIIGKQREADRWVRMLAGVAGLVVVLAYGFASAVGFFSQSLGVLVAGREKAQAGYAEADEDLKNVEKRLYGLGVLRPAADLQADLDKQRRNPMWQISRGCKTASKQAVRAFCDDMDTLRAEQGRVVEGGELRKEIAKLKNRRRDARARGGMEPADYRTAAMVSLFGWKRETINAGFSWLPSVLVEFISAFGLLAVDQSSAKGKDQGLPREPAWRVVDGGGEGEALRSHG